MDFTLKLDIAMKELSSHGAFLTVKSNDKVNTMTVSWGFIGFIWHKPYFIALVRPQRYTKGIIDSGDSFTISLPFGDTLKKELITCGTKSGKDINKGEVVEFVNSKSVDSPIVKGCNMYYECKINYKDDFKEELLPDYVKKTFYRDDYHTIYFGEIVECYEG